MDLSAVIFVVLALAWAVYLIPKALKHHDEMASDRLVDGHSDKVRVLTRKAKAVAAQAADALTPDATEPAPAEALEEPEPDVARPVEPVLTRSAARKAAQRRRRVLGLLLLALAVVWTLTWFAYLPIWAPAVPGALCVAWLVIARLSVRKQQRRRRVAPVAAPVAAAMVDQVVEEGRQARLETTNHIDELIDGLADEDTTGLARADIEAALADDGSLWDPLPMTLPTYVNKARARRTVRTIELTGISSSGHDDADTVIAREAAESAREVEETEARRKAAGA